MANFTPFKFTTKGLDLEYEVQGGKVLRFSKFVLGDGYNTGSIRDLTSLINFVREEPITRMEITGVGDKKRIRLGFDLDTTEITTGFYLREIGIMAIDPDTQEEILMFYTNAGETADYITNDTSSTVTTKLINAEIYVTDVAEITATIDSSLVYALKGEFNELVTKVNDLEDEIENIHIPSDLSEFNNDVGFLTEETDPTVPQHVKGIKQSDIDKWNEGGTGTVTTFENITVLTTDWQSDETYDEFEYRVDIPCPGITDNYFPEVVFSLTEAISGNYSPICVSGNGIVSIYAVELPENDIIIPTISCSEGA